MARPEQVSYLREEFERRYCFARAVRSRGHLYVSGVTSLDIEGNLVGEGSMEAQLQQIYQTLQQILRMHGLTFEHVIKEVAYVTDMAALVRANHVRAAFYHGFAPPAMTGVQVAGLLRPEMMAEIELIAELP